MTVSSVEETSPVSDASDPGNVRHSETLELEQTSHRSTSPTVFNDRVHGGRSTPVPRFQPSVDASSYHTRTDIEGYLPVGSARGYVAVDPFVPSVAQSVANLAYPYDYIPSLSNHRPSTPMPPTSYQSTRDIFDASTSKYILAFILDTLPRQIYLHILLTLPSLYFSRVARIFEEAELSMPYIKKMVVLSADQWPGNNHSMSLVNANPNFAPSIISPHFSQLKTTWELFIDSLTREWKTLNIVSVLLLSAILTTLQIDGATTDPFTRYSALLALVCSLMSLLYGCLYILRFNTMRKVHKAAEWAEEAQKSQTAIWWNVWVLLALPSIWLSWSIIFYLTCVMSFVWRPRVAITFVFVLGIVYLALVISEFRRYGDVMDKAWRKRIMEWGETSGSVYDAPSIRRRTSNSSSRVTSPALHPQSSPSHVPFLPPIDFHAKPRSEVLPAELGIQPSHEPPLLRPFNTTKVMDLRFMNHLTYQRPSLLDERGVTSEDWTLFISDASMAWDGRHPRFKQDSGTMPVARLPPQVMTAHIIAWWNGHFLQSRGAEAILCEEHTLDNPESPSHAIYLVDLGRPPDEVAEVSGGPSRSTGLAERFGLVPEGLERIDIYDPVPDANVSRSHRMGKTLIYGGPHEARVHWRSSRPPEPNSRWLPIANTGNEEDEDEGDSVVQTVRGHRAPNVYPRSAMRRSRASTREGLSSSDDEGVVGDDEGEASHAHLRDPPQALGTVAVQYGNSDEDISTQLSPRPRFHAHLRRSGPSSEGVVGEEGHLSDEFDHVHPSVAEGTIARNADVEEDAILPGD
ncbi:hypothetical protein C0991_003678 [Blastosporella zonata]|nr:hypothetical protein C0991_003678 [Blastosporella zonata]